MSFLAKAYDPKPVEEKWYSFWDQKGFFHADENSPKPSFSISIPPPNVTGVLHMGHALVDTLIDVLTRWKRMSGFEALWVPGTDHAGIATQTVVERNLIAQGKKRTDMSREEFVKLVWEWKEKSESQILSQLKRLGCSCDWSRLAFTMDEARSRAVRVMFKKMYDAGLIFRGDYLVNWDPVSQTALADDEVEHEEKNGFLYYFRYPLEDVQDGSIIIATTRPETMLGDTAVAISPADDRAGDLVGKHVMLPFMNRAIPIISDHRVDPAFGTGLVKVTPAHDHEDRERALDYDLPSINIMTPDGRINENGGPFQGLSMAEARIAVVEKMKELGLLVKIEPHMHRVGVSYRSKAVIEPYLSKQWFVRLTSFKQQLREAVQSKRVELIPPHWENTYYHWIDNLRDWCISRQLWWGHRIPIWYRKDNPEISICYDGEGVPPEVAKEPHLWQQDKDVLDTWFSSGLWPFSILGWPDNTPDMQKFYPNSVLVTGHDILFFWVARMICMGEYATGKPPFHQVFLHGLIYGKSYWRVQESGNISYVTGKEREEYDLGKPQPTDIHSKWEKMSKSKGNIIDPIEIIDSYGTDAMRFALCASATHARQIDLDRRRFEEFKNFTNKVWNGARFVFMNIENLPPAALQHGLDRSLFTIEDRWILSLLGRITQEVQSCLENYAFDRAALSAYDFFWKEFCAYYVELVKPVLFDKSGTPAQKENKQKILTVVLLSVIRLLHPMAPFITEELFQHLKTHFSGIQANPAADPYTQEAIRALLSPACIVAPYPQVVEPNDIQPEIEELFAFLTSIVTTVRNIRAEMQIPPGQATDILIIGQPNDPDSKLVRENMSFISALVRTQKIEILNEEKNLPFSASSMIKNLKVIVPLPEEMREKEKIRLTKERDKLITEVNRVTGQLANPDFLQKAPAPFVDKLKAQLAQAEKELLEVMAKLSI